MTEGEIGEGDEAGGEGESELEDEFEGDSHNTDIEPYSRTFSSGNKITVESP